MTRSRWRCRWLTARQRTQIDVTINAWTLLTSARARRREGTPGHSGGFVEVSQCEGGVCAEVGQRWRGNARCGQVGFGRRLRVQRARVRIRLSHALYIISIRHRVTCNDVITVSDVTYLRGLAVLQVVHDRRWTRLEQIRSFRSSSTGSSADAE